MRRLRGRMALVAAVMTMPSVLLAPAAWAGDGAGAAGPVTESPAGTGSDPGAGPLALAHTGLDVTMPMIVGLAVLLVGTLLVAWAVLHGSRSRGSHS